MDIWSTEEGDSGSLLHSRGRQTPSSVRSVQHNSEEKLLGQEVCTVVFVNGINLSQS